MTLMIRFRLLERDKLAVNLLKKGLLVQGEAMEFNNIPKAQVKDLVLFQRFPASQWIILVAQEAHFMDLIMKFKTSPVMRKNKDDESKADAEVAEKQVGDEQPV
ncbi:hypothetical protein Tco_1396261 [Tanacetum coccineum]